MSEICIEYRGNVYRNIDRLANAVRGNKAFSGHKLFGSTASRIKTNLDNGEVWYKGISDSVENFEYYNAKLEYPLQLSEDLTVTSRADFEQKICKMYKRTPQFLTNTIEQYLILKEMPLSEALTKTYEVVKRSYESQKRYDENVQNNKSGFRPSRKHAITF